LQSRDTNRERAQNPPSSSSSRPDLSLYIRLSLYRAKISIDDRRLLIAFNGYKTGLLCQKKTTTGGCADRRLILCDVTIDQRALLKCKRPCAIAAAAAKKRHSWADSIEVTPLGTVYKIFKYITLLYLGRVAYANHGHLIHVYSINLCVVI
jgi:hypothetical protein